MNSRLLGAVSACVITIITQSVQAVPVSGQGTWETTLEGRDLDGNAATYEAYYDTDLDITWLADPILAASNSFGVPTDTWLGPYPSDSSGASGYIHDGSGVMNWPGALFWIDAMNASDYLGYNGWRLPTMSPVNGTSFDTRITTDGTSDRGNAAATTDGSDGGWRDSSNTPVSELGQMYSVNLGNLGRCAPTLPWCTEQAGYGLSNTGPFDNLPNFPYWTDTEFSSERAYYMNFADGYRDTDFKQIADVGAWAVHDGDIGAVPVPAAVWLFASGLIGLVGVARRKVAPRNLDV